MEMLAPSRLGLGVTVRSERGGIPVLFLIRLAGNWELEGCMTWVRCFLSNDTIGHG